MRFDKSKKITKLASDQCLHFVFQVGKQKQEKGQKWLQDIGCQFAFCWSFSGKNKRMEPRYVRTLVLRVIGVRKYYVPIFQGVKM